MNPKRRRIEITGSVQGVGFRPFVYRLAHQHRLVGWVINDARGVTLEVQGGLEELTRFTERLLGELPPAAVIDATVSSAFAGEAPKAIATWAPSPANAWAIARPIPREAPVTRARRPAKSPLMPSAPHGPR